MRERWLPLALALASPLAALALFEGMLVAGLAPLAVFAPLYALVRSLGAGGEAARRRAGAATVAATVGVGLAWLPALLSPMGTSLPSWGTLGLGLVAAGSGTLAALACAPEAGTTGDRERWAFIHAMGVRHARGLAGLAAVALPAGTLVAFLREAPLVELEDGIASIPEAVLGANVVSGALVLPDPSSAFVLAVPLSLAPLALGFLTSPKRSAPLALGGLAVAVLAPVVHALDAPVRAPNGALVPISILDRPGLAVVDALAPASAGLLAGAALVYTARRGSLDTTATRGLTALGAALATALLWGLAPGAIVAVGIIAAVLVVGVTTGRAPFGLAILLGALVGALASWWGAPTGWAAGALVGVAAGAGAGTFAAARSIEVPDPGLRSPWVLVYALLGALAVAAVVGLAGSAFSKPGLVFPAPHARALTAGLDAVLAGRGLWLVVWGLVAGGLVEVAVGGGAWVAVGALAGPGVAGLVLAGSLLRAAWEQGLLARAREGYVMRGQLGYELLRAHALVVGVLAGEGFAVVLVAVWG